MLQRSSPEYRSGTQTGRNTPDLGFFDSENFQLLGLTQERKEERLRCERVRARQERLKRGPLLERIWSPELGYYSRLYRNDGNPKPKKVPVQPETFFGLRRPLNALEQRVVAAMPAYEKDHKDWADKPFSTIYTGWNAYKGRFPLLMHLNSDSEDKDVTVIQTETRRMSLVTTDYSKGIIKLADDGDEVKYAVFPMLHQVIESEDEEDDDNDDDETGSESDAENEGKRPPPLLPQDVLDRLEAIAAQRNENDDDDYGSDESEDAEPPPEHKNTRMQTERRLSITTRPCAEKPRILKRRSLDYGALFYHNEVSKLENMGSITEVTEDESSSPNTLDGSHGLTSTTTMEAFSSAPPEGTWAMAAEAKERKSRSSRDRAFASMLRQAEQEMEHIMDENLHKLEDFLEHFDDEVIPD